MPPIISISKGVSRMYEFSCPSSFGRGSKITMAEGSGGKAMQDLIKRVIAPIYGQGFSPDHDGAVINLSGKLAFTTDSYVVKPLFFPGGDIGKLAVYGTINDLAMCGARPLYLSCSLILEEGFPVQALEAICTSMADAARANHVSIVTGDTKVVGRGQADGLYINTSGVGTVDESLTIHPKQISPGDILILSGDLGRHGIAVLSGREGFSFAQAPESDCASLLDPISAILIAGIKPKCLRDLTRGGLAAALHEISAVASLGMEIQEERIPVDSRVRGACEILGLDPLSVANEGRFLAIVASDDAPGTLEVLKSCNVSHNATTIGCVTASRGIEILSPYGSRRLLPPLHGELLPRIC